MIEAKKQATNTGVGFGLLLQIAGRVMMVLIEGPAGIAIGAALVLAGAGLFIWGCVSYCQGKGQPAILGLLGLFSCLGLAILVLLPDHHKNG